MLSLVKPLLLCIIFCTPLVACQGFHHAQGPEDPTQQGEFANKDITAPWNDPVFKDDINAPWNNPVTKDDPSAPWNNEFGTYNHSDMTPPYGKYNNNLYNSNHNKEDNNTYQPESMYEPLLPPTY